MKQKQDKNSHNYKLQDDDLSCGAIPRVEAKPKANLDFVMERKEKKLTKQEKKTFH